MNSTRGRVTSSNNNFESRTVVELTISIIDARRIIDRMANGPGRDGEEGDGHAVQSVNPPGKGFLVPEACGVGWLQVQQTPFPNVVATAAIIVWRSNVR